MRKIGSLFKRILKKIPFVFMLLKICRILLNGGIGALRGYLAERKRCRRLKFTVSKKERTRQEKTQFLKNYKYSILVPLYNTNEKFLREMIMSVKKQTYKNWELCLADGSDLSHGYVEATVKEYAQNDKRIVYKKLKENGGISENTNAALGIASGDYIALFDHDDILHPSALFYVNEEAEKGADFIYTDENTFSLTPKKAYCPNFKPDFAPDTLRSYNYICHLTVFSKKLSEKVGGFRSECDGSQDYDLILRLTEKAEKIAHIQKELYYWRAHKESTASDISAKPYVLSAAKKALSDHLQRAGLKGEVVDAFVPSTYRIKYEIEGSPEISVIIPNMDHIKDLDKCLKSIEKSTYENYEIIIVENNSVKEETFEYYKTLETNEKIKVVKWEGEFNFAAICNFGAKYALGEHLLFLNNDIEIITNDWLEELLMFSQRSDVGAVGAKLLYPDDTVQHAGVILGIGGIAGHSHKGFLRNDYGYMSRLGIIQNYSAVTAALIMIRKEVYNEVGGFDEGYKVAFNDVDLCMKIRKADYLIVYTPYVEAYHYESKSRGTEDNPEKVKRFNGEIERFRMHWQSELDKGDPYYNRNLRLDSEKFEYY